MKKYLIIASAALVALAACTKEQDLREPSPIKEGAVLTFTSQRPQMTPDTKTAWNSTTSSIDWTSGDKISVGYTLGGNWMAKSSAADLNADPKVSPRFYSSTQVTIDTDDPSIGTFQVPSSFDFVEAGKAVFYGVYPNSALGSNVDYAPSLTVTIPTGQIPGNNTFDSAADIMVAQSGEITLTDAFPADPIELDWTRIVAHADLTFTGLKDDGNETVSKITLTFNDEAKVAGSFYVDVKNGNVTTNNGSKNEIVLSGTNLSINEHSIKAWASLMPVTFTSLNVEIETNKAVYSRAISASRTFAKNARNKLTIKMADASRTEKTGQLVADGYYVISYGDNMMTVGTESELYRGRADKDVDSPSNNAIWRINYNSTEDAYTILSFGAQKELRGVTTSNTNLYIGGSAGTNLFTIEKSSAEATTYKIAPKGNTSRAIGYNISSPRFALYVGSDKQPITLDLTSVTVVETPVLAIEDITLANGAAVTSPVTITPSSKVFVNSITVNGVYSDPECTTAASWLTVTYSEEVLAYTATANETGAERTAYVSVKGIGTSAETADVIFSVTQPKIVSYSNKWVLVTSASELAANDKVVIVDTDGTKALGTTQNTNNRAAVNVTLDTEDNNIVNINNDVQQLTLGKDGDNWTFYTGTGYLYAASSSSNVLKTQTTYDANGTWAITIDTSSNVASITAQGTNTRNQLKNNGNIFSCYSSGQTDVKIYKFHEDPTAPTLSVSPATTEDSPAAWEADNDDAKQFTVTATNGTWSFNADGVSSWANVSKNGDVLTVTPNEKQASEAHSGSIVITLTPATSGYEAKTATIYLKQKKYSAETPTSVSYDFTGSDWTVTNGTLSNGTVSFTGKGETNFKMNEGYFFMGKSGAYLTFPSYEYPVTKIVVTGKSGASGSVKQNIYVNDTAVSTETTGATGTNTYNIGTDYQATGTIYTLKVTSNHNTQITKIEVFFN